MPADLEKMFIDVGLETDLPPFYGPGAMLVNSEF
jgi:hypothetical protein